PYFFLAAPLAGVASGLAPLDLVPAPTPPSAEPVMPKRSLKRCTRPPRSMDWRTPVHAGWVLGSMSRRSVAPSLPQVDFVSNDVPSVITTVILWYSGWIFSFITNLQRFRADFRPAGATRRRIYR